MAPGGVFSIAESQLPAGQKRLYLCVNCSNGPDVRLLSPVTLLICIIITFVVLLTPSIPLGVVGVNADGSEHIEWAWQRHAGFGGFVDGLGRLFPAVLGGGLLFGISQFGVKQCSSASKLKTATLYLALLVATCCWFRGVQQTAPAAHRETKPYWVLYDTSASGYFFEAVYRMDSTSEFLATYETKMGEGDVLHVGTHPPGLFLLAKGCLQICEKSPVLVRCLQSIEPPGTRHAFRFLEREVGWSDRLTPAEQQLRLAKGSGPRNFPLSQSEFAGLQLLSEFSALAVVLTILPIALLSHLLFDRVTSWKLCCLWGTIPCLAVFAPKSDVLFPLTCTSTLAFGVAAMHLTSRKSFLWAVAAGGVLWVGLMMSLAHLPVVALLLALLVLRAWQSGGRTVRRDVGLLATGAGTVLLLCVGWHLATGCNMLNVWKMNLSNHAGFYDQFPRTWWKWLLVNPLELAFAVGLPLFVVAIGGVAKSLRDVFLQGKQSMTEFLSPAFCIAAALTLDALWLSGKNQGEAARLWCFLTPWLVVMSGRLLGDVGDVMQVEERSTLTGWRMLMAAQLLVATATVSCVSGFSF